MPVYKGIAIKVTHLAAQVLADVVELAGALRKEL